MADLPEPVVITTSVSRPLVTERTASSWPGRRSSKPSRSCARRRMLREVGWATSALVPTSTALTHSLTSLEKGGTLRAPRRRANGVSELPHLPTDGLQPGTRPEQRGVPALPGQAGQGQPAVSLLRPGAALGGPQGGEAGQGADLSACHNPQPWSRCRPRTRS